MLYILTSLKQFASQVCGSSSERPKPKKTCGCCGACECNKPSFVTAAFRSCKENEAYIFLKNKYVVDNYCPGLAKDIIVSGPTKISEGFACLNGTVFANPRIDCAFASHDAGKAYIFSGDYCALLDYSPCHPERAHFVQGPAPITQIFSFLKCTVFETGIDAAFESSIHHEAYLFKGDKYARISYAGFNPHLMNQGPIGQFWPCLKGTIFEINIGSAFASHRHNEAYLFKGEYFARIKFTPGASSDYLIGGVHMIKDYWPELGKLLPQPNQLN